MQTGEVEANLVKLNEKYKLDYLPELIERKVSGKEKEILPDADLKFYKTEYERLVAELEKAKDETFLHEKPSAKEELNDLLIRVRLKTHY